MILYIKYLLLDDRYFIVGYLVMRILGYCFWFFIVRLVRVFFDFFMDFVWFGEDYYDYFDFNVYLNFYFKVEGCIEVYNDFVLRCFYEFWFKVNNKN